MDVDERLKAVVTEQPYPLLFATVSGAHLYGFPSPDSDHDLRGAHILPAHEVLGLYERKDTIETCRDTADFELDLVTHDCEKFFRLLLKKNGYVLEQLHSPLVVYTTPEHDELKQLAELAVTRHHVHHYLGFANTQWELFKKENPPRIKPLLYVYRVLLTGLHLMRTGQVEAHLPTLNLQAKLSYIDDLIATKTVGTEKGTLSTADLAFHEREYLRLRSELELAAERSSLPEAPRCKQALSDLLVRLRLASDLSINGEA